MRPCRTIETRTDPNVCDPGKEGLETPRSDRLKMSRRIDREWGRGRGEVHGIKREKTRRDQYSYDESLVRGVLRQELPYRQKSCLVYVCLSFPG